MQEKSKPTVAPSLNTTNLYFIFREFGEEVRVLLLSGCVVSDKQLDDAEKEHFENKFNATYKPLWKFPASI